MANLYSAAGKILLIEVMVCSKGIVLYNEKHSDWSSAGVFFVAYQKEN